MSDHVPGPMIASSICIKCGNTFFTSSSNQRIIPGMKFNLYERDPNKDRPLRTWADWLEHITVRCSACRYPEPPQICLDDLHDTMIDKHKEREYDKKSEREEDAQKLAPYGRSKMSDKPRISVVLLGPPASGKGTLGKALSEYCNVPIIMPGGIYRNLMTEDSPVGEQVREHLKDGGYCPDSMTNTVVKNEATKVISMGASSVIMDGYPRTLNQFEYMFDNYEIAYYISLDQPYDVLLSRAMNRYECPICHEICSKQIQSLQCECLTNTNEYIIRKDDTEDMFPKRYETYLKLTQPVVDYLNGIPNSGKHKFKNISTPLTPHTINLLCRDISNELKSLNWC